MNRDQMVTILCKQTGTGEHDLDPVVRKANLKLRTERQCGTQQAKGCIWWGEGDSKLPGCWMEQCLYHWKRVQCLENTVQILTEDINLEKQAYFSLYEKYALNITWLELVIVNMKTKDGSKFMELVRRLKDKEDKFGIVKQPRDG